jgi:hypothetical protein
VHGHLKAAIKVQPQVLTAAQQHGGRAQQAFSVPYCIQNTLAWWQDVMKFLTAAPLVAVITV